MNNFFNLDNGLFTFLGKLCDVIILSLLWLVLCIPIITIGPATTALYYACVKVLRGERGYLMTEFFRSFKLNFKRGAMIGIILTVVAIILGVDIYASANNNVMNGKTNAILYGIYISLAILTLSISIYIFPLLSRFEMNTKQLFKAAAIMAIKHLPSTVCMIVVTVAAGFGMIFVLPSAFLPGVTALINSLFLERIFKIYMPKEEEQAETSDEDTLSESEMIATEIDEKEDNAN